MSSPVLSTIGAGLLLGWSVAWPPGPINAEMIRRGLTRGFFAAWVVGLGASTGDFLWALAVALGAGALAGIAAARPVLGAVSLGLLLFLAFTFFRGAFRSHHRARAGDAATPPPAGRLASTRGGFLLGLGVALSSPWNVAFWLAAFGRQATRSPGLALSILFAASVVAAAIAWTVFLCSAVRLGARFATPAWETATQAITGAVMLWFAIDLAIRLFSGGAGPG